MRRLRYREGSVVGTLHAFTRAGAYASQAPGALVVVDDGQIVHHRYRLRGTLSCAHSAAYAAHSAEGHRLFPLAVGTAGDVDLGFCRNTVDAIFGADVNAGAAGEANFALYECDVVLAYAYGVDGADGLTGAAA